MTPAGEGCITTAFKEALRKAKDGTADERERVKRDRERQRKIMPAAGKKRKRRGDAAA